MGMQWIAEIEAKARTGVWDGEPVIGGAREIAVSTQSRFQRYHQRTRRQWRNYGVFSLHRYVCLWMEDA